MYGYEDALMKADTLSKKAGVPLDKYIASIIEHEKDKRELEASRKADPEEKAKVDAYLLSLNGNLSEDLTPSDICAAANVRQIQGTRSYARFHVKRLLLEHHK